MPIANEKPEIPGWAVNSPIPESGSLTLWGEENSLKEINLTLEEYECLRKHLVALRGYFRAGELHRFVHNGVDGYSFGQGDHQQLAFHLETARDLFQAIPSLVVAPEMPAGWDELLSVGSRSAPPPEGFKIAPEGA